MTKALKKQTHKENLKSVLELLEGSICSEVEDKLMQDWIDFLENKSEDDVFVPTRDTRRTEVLSCLSWLSQQ